MLKFSPFKRVYTYILFRNRLLSFLVFPSLFFTDHHCQKAADNNHNHNHHHHTPCQASSHGQSCHPEQPHHHPHSAQDEKGGGQECNGCGGAAAQCRGEYDQWHRECREPQAEESRGQLLQGCEWSLCACLCVCVCVCVCVSYSHSFRIT